MVEPIFWLGLSFLLVAVALTAVLVTLVPAVRELARAARSAEKLFDTLNRELPPTLESIRLTGIEITDLTDEVNQGVQSASRVVQQVDQSITGVKQQARKAQRASRSLVVGFKAAWESLTQSAPPPSKGRRTVDTSNNRLPASTTPPADWEDYESSYAAPSRDAEVESWEYELEVDERYVGRSDLPAEEALAMEPAPEIHPMSLPPEVVQSEERPSPIQPSPDLRSSRSRPPKRT